MGQKNNKIIIIYLDHTLFIIIFMNLWVHNVNI